MERDTKNLDALLASLNRSAERFQTLWFSFLTLTLYLVLTALMTTHRMLLLEEAQSLPIVNLKIGLLPFYWIAPLIYLVLHFYVLVMLLLLARTADSFEQTLLNELPIASEREQFRMRFENALFLQLLVGAKAEREGENSLPLIVIALTTLAIAPVGTLLVIQMQFLPYHHLGITYWHRAAVLIDCVLIWLLWRGYRRHGVICWPRFPKAAWRERRPDWLKRAAPAAAGIAITLWASLWEGRWAGEPLIDPEAGWQPRVLVSIGWVSDRLSLPNETIVGEALLLEKQKEAQSGGGQRTVPTRNFRDRNFAYADFSSADLRGVSFDGSQIRRANLAGAQLQHATLESAQLQQATLRDIQMQGANLKAAQLQGANLWGARLQGTRFARANLRAVTSVNAQMQAADFTEAHLQGADFSHSQMQSVTLIDAQMQGSALKGVDLSGAALDGAQLQGALLDQANISGAQLLDTFLFRSGDTIKESGSAWYAGMTYGKLKPSYPNPLPITDADVTQLLALVVEHLVPDDWRRTTLTERFDRFKPSLGENDNEEASFWAAAAERSTLADPDERHRRIALAQIYRDLACADGDGAPYVARSLIGQPPNSRLPVLSRLGDQLDEIRSQLKAGRRGTARCPGTEGFTEADWRQLDAIKPLAVARYRNPDGGGF